MDNVKRKYFYYIYKITFLKGEPEGRYYYGKRTYYGLSIDNDNYTGSGNFCFAYFNKYGTILNETYLKEIIEITNNQQENLDREEYWIGDLWKIDPLCMNQCPGGKGSADHDTNCFVQDKYKKDIAQYDLYGNFIRSWHGIRETARELGINRQGINACITGRKPSAFGFQWKYFNGSEEPIEPFFKIEPIEQFTRSGEKIGEFESPSDAEHELGIDSGSIRQVCQGKRVAAGDYIWRFKGDDFNKHRIALIDPKDKNRVYEKKIRPVLQYNSIGNFIAEYNNAHEAAAAVNGKCPRMIYDVARGDGRHKTAYGFIWKFKEDLED